MDAKMPKKTVTDEDLEHGLRGVLTSGMATRAMSTFTGGAFLVAFALKLGASNFVIGLLAAIPALAQLWQVFNMRDRGSGFLCNEITRNPFIWGALMLCVGLLLLAVYLRGLAVVLKLAARGARGWVLVVVMSLVLWVMGQILKSKAFRRETLQPKVFKPSRI